MFMQSYMYMAHRGYITKLLLLLLVSSVIPKTNEINGFPFFLHAVTARVFDILGVKVLANPYNFMIW